MSFTITPGHPRNCFGCLFDVGQHEAATPNPTPNPRPVARLVDEEETGWEYADHYEITELQINAR